ncbi:hypothetical protein FZW96_11265 [Bacillus sp. BGMRC 2118]|nr:hypothetical protein FZW96_11265 [Bacillus sp. BGMRC 2118]
MKYEGSVNCHLVPCMTASIYLQRFHNMNSWNLFFGRLLKSWKFQYDVVKQVADWTIQLYIIIPSIVFFIIIYRSWWEETPSWFAGTPLVVLLFLIYLVAWTGTIRTYIEEADKVFLIKKYHLIRDLRLWGYSYSLLFQLITLVVAIVILSPFFIQHYMLARHELFALFIYIAGMKLCIMFISFHLNKLLSKWQRIVIGLIVFVMFSWVSGVIFVLFTRGVLLPALLCGGLFVIGSVYLSVKTLLHIKSLDHEIDMEQERKTSIIQFIFMAAPEIEKPVIKRSKKPLLFQKSKRIFSARTPLNGYSEFFIKVFIRNFAYVSGYFTLINVTTGAIIILPPIWLKSVVGLGFLLIKYFWLSSVWDKIFSMNPLMKKYNESNSFFIAKRRVITIMYVVSIFLLTLFVIVAYILLNKVGLRFK